VSNADIVPGFDDEVCDYLEIKLQKTDSDNVGLKLLLTGSIDAYNSACFKRRVMKVIAAGFVRLSFMMSGVDIVSSTGVATLLSLQKGGCRIRWGDRFGGYAIQNQRCV
jgi:hypothetical protein